MNSYVRASWTKSFESMLPLKMRLLSGEIATQTTCDSCLVFISWTGVGVCWVSTSGTSQRDHRRMVLSTLPETMKNPSVENSMARILLVCPMRSRHTKNWDCCWRVAAKQFSRNDETLREKPLTEAPAVALILVFNDFFFFDATTSTLKKFQTKINCW